MPCYADTIVRIKYVKQSVNKKGNSDLLVVWALGAYPVECEEFDIELVLFLPVDSSDRDPESQAVFEKDNFYSVGVKIVTGYFNGNKRAKMTVATSTHLKILNNVVESNKCPLKVSLVGISQEVPHKIKDNFIFNILINDYVGKECNFIMKVVFPSHDSCFAHLKDKIRSQESLVFVVGQMEIIVNEFYIYAKDINYVDTNSIVKNRGFENSLNQSSSVSHSSVRSKLLATHQDIFDNSKDKIGNEASASYKPELRSYSSKREQNDVESSVNTEYAECESSNFDNEGVGDEFNYNESVKRKKVSREKGKERADGSLHSSLRSYSSNVVCVEEYQP
ncbi:1104_t:CDS:2 [Gigaspora rosea]|nr:1104_t:CDS:2 [Gigaspora rosea]